MRIRGLRYDTGQAVAVEISGGKIARLDPLDGPAGGLPWLAPGLIDIQFNGYGGQEFSSAELTVEKVAAIVDVLAPQGVARFCPTVTTNSIEVMTHAMRTLRAACESSSAIARRVLGIHQEGPYISPVDGPRGAHPLPHCKAPDWDEFQRTQEAAGGRIRILTLAPEYDGSPAFIARVVNSGVLVAIGHTSADSDQIRAAVDAGARLSTHLGNGSHVMIRRHPNYIWDQLAEDRLVAGIIADGHHLPAAVVKTIVRAKTPERIVLVSDISGLAGSPPGVYGLGGPAPVEVLSDGRIVVAGQDQLLAGASRPLGVCLANAIRMAGVDLATAVQMAVHHPLELLGHPAPELAAGAAADLLLFDLPGADGSAPLGEFTARATVVGGEVVFGDSPAVRP